MMGPSRFRISIGRYFGIRFYLDPSWFLIAAMVTYALSAEVFPSSLRGHSQALYVIMGVIGALTFFLSILLHELGHSLVSQRCGIPVPRITLFFIGGVAEISREPDSAPAELKIAAAGPAVSILLSLVYGVAAYITFQLRWGAASIVLQWLALVNLTLVIFNAIPGYPLDGGRILRAILWARTKNLRRATFITTRIGVGFSWALMALGVIFMFQGAWDAFVFFIIGMFLKNAAEAGYTNTLYHELLGDIRVGDVMTRSPACIPAHTPINLAVDEFFLVRNHVAFPVIDDEREFRGLLRLDYLKALPKEKWPYTTAGDLAGSEEGMGARVDIDKSAEATMRRMLSTGEGRLAVLENGKVAGIITRHDILHFIAIHTELEESAERKPANPGDTAALL